MTPTAKRNRRLLNNLVAITRKINRKLNQTMKNTPGFSRCKSFCKNDYIPRMYKALDRGFAKYNIPRKAPIRRDDAYAYNACKKTFCNETCDGYDFFGDKRKQREFKQQIHNGFHNTYARDKIVMSKKRGAMSGCVDYNNENAVSLSRI